MKFSPCVIIPIYNHGSTIKSVVQDVTGYDLPIIVVDDGSDQETIDSLKQLELENQDIVVFYRDKNGGKGLAVRDAMRIAVGKGYSHGLQIDADGQHDTSFIPQFLDLAEKNKEAVILANPTFDSSAPWVRCWGRKISTVLIWLQTLSFEVKDGLCGFRVYPLSSSFRILERGNCGERMDFDPSLLVRLIWSGAPIINLDTPVTYPEDGISNFRYLSDNLLIARSHILLVLGMIVRAPKLLFRKFFKDRSKQGSDHWSDLKEQGTYWTSLLMLRAYQLLGRKLSTMLAIPISFYFYLTNRNARVTSKTYLTNLGNKHGVLKKFTVRSHIAEFAKCLVDKLAVWNGDIGFDDLNWKSREEFYSLIDRKQGFVILSAHVGNIEIGRALSRKHYKFKVNALMFRRHAKSFRRILQKLNLDSDLSIVAMEDIGSDTIINLKKKVEDGEIVTLLADRISAGSPDKSIEMDFLGKPASFPIGPFLLASMCNCPVYTIFFLREPDGRYTIRFSHFADLIDLPRKGRAEKLRNYVGRYVVKLEEQVKDYPLQWFNFYPFWGIPERPVKDTTVGVVSPT